MSPRAERLVRECVRTFELDLGGLTVLTEAATGAYLYTPLIAAAAGAERVLAFAADSPYGSRDDVAAATRAAAASMSLGDRVEVVFEKTPEIVGAADVVTNTGFVRPIDRTLVGWMKPTAVVPLMWETWEAREGEVDLDACRERGILVLGTDESRPPAAMYPYSAALALRLLFELGLEAYKTRVLLLGSDPSLAGSIAERLPALGADVRWFSTAGAGGTPYEQLREDDAADVDAIVVAEHSNPALLVGGLLDPKRLAERNPSLAVGVVSGGVDEDALRASGLRFHPERLRPFGYMSYGTDAIGPRPVLELYAAGLSVAQAMARARLAGLSPEDAAEQALASSPAMDFATGR